MAERFNQLTTDRSCVLRRSSTESMLLEQPFRDELLSADQLERHARQIAARAGHAGQYPIDGGLGGMPANVLPSFR